jgi:hypothetical protein
MDGWMKGGRGGRQGGREGREGGRAAESERGRWIEGKEERRGGQQARFRESWQIFRECVWSNVHFDGEHGLDRSDSGRPAASHTFVARSFSCLFISPSV